MTLTPTKTKSSIDHNDQPPNTKNFHNVLLASSCLVPLFGSLAVAHQTREKVLDLLEKTMVERGQKDGERAMIVDISAKTWNWDTYTMVDGAPQSITLVYPDQKSLRKCLHFDGDDTVRRGVLVPQLQTSLDQEETSMVWVPKGSVLRDTLPRDDGMTEFVLDLPFDPHNDRLEQWEQEVEKEWIHETRAELVLEAMRNMLRFYELDRIVCWDLSWGIWEAIRDKTGECDDDGFPLMNLLGKDDKDDIPFASFNDEKDQTMKLLYDYCRPITPNLLADTLHSVSGYYLMGGNTYIMSLFHHMWDQQKKTSDRTSAISTGHMELLRNLLSDGRLFYLGHSAGAIMSGPNILTATLKRIDAFSIITQPYNAPFLRLPPSESPETFFVAGKNNLATARSKMLEKMRKYGAWRGYQVVDALAFPHYDSRPQCFPQSAETYLRATDEEGQFHQKKASLLVEKDKGKDKENRSRVEHVDLRIVREDANAKQIPCYPIADGHSIVLPCGGVEVVETLSPEEEGVGTLHWDTHMPKVTDEDYDQYACGRTQFKAGSFSSNADTMAGDRSSTSEYNGARIFSRLEALGLPVPSDNKEDGGELFRT